MAHELIKANKLAVIHTQGSRNVGTSHLNIVAAGPLTKQPGTNPYRFVIVAYENGEFSVHTEYFSDITNLKKSSLSNGHYFKAGPEGFVKAVEKFSEKVAQHAEYMASVYRAETVEV